MEQQMMSVHQAAQQWQLSVRRVQTLCSQGRVKGATLFGKSWMIPADTPRPADRRSREGREETPQEVGMPRRSPSLSMTDLYSKPGSALQVSRSLQGNPKAQRRFDAGIAYYRGNIEEVSEYAVRFLENRTGTFAILGAGLLLGYCAIWRGDLQLWKQARKHIASVPLKERGDLLVGEMVLAELNSAVFENAAYPRWFEKGIFEELPADSLPAACTFYSKYLYLRAYAVASRQMNVEGVQGLALMRLLPNVIEPMISQTVFGNALIPQIHLRLWCASVYHDGGQDALAVPHIDKAIELALPDQLLGVLAEHWQQLDTLLEQRLSEKAPQLVRSIRELHRQYSAGKATLRTALQNRKIADNLTVREREVAKLIAFGFRNRQVAKALGISENTVKSIVRNIMQKADVKNRADFVSIL